MVFTFNDGGRAAAGYRGDTRDCAVRALSIALDLPYGDVYGEMNEIGAMERVGSRKRGKSNSRTGVYKQAVHRFMRSHGWKWTPTMAIASGCRVHLRGDELPTGRLVANISKHYVAVIDGVIHDTSDPSREGTRCVYGYWQPNG